MEAKISKNPLNKFYVEEFPILYTEQDLIDFIEWVDLNDLAFIGWKKWKCTTTVSEIECNTTKELLEIWKNER